MIQVTKQSEARRPDDLRPGFKPWDETQERYWMGSQWSETYTPIKDIPMRKSVFSTYQSVPKQVRAVRYGSDEGGEFYNGAVQAVASFMRGLDHIDETLSQHDITDVIRPRAGQPWDPDAGFANLDIYDDVAHHSWLPLGLGDYVVEGINGEFYPCEAAIFHLSYDKIS